MIVTTSGQLQELVEAYSGFDEFAFDVETNSLDPHTNRVYWISLAGPGRGDTIPLGHPLGDLVTPAYKEREPWWDAENPTKTGKPRKKWRTVHHPPVFSDPPEQLWPEEVFTALRPLFFSERRKIGHNVKFDLGSVKKYFGEHVPPPYGDTLIACHLLDESLPKSLEQVIKREFQFEYEQMGKFILESSFRDIARYSFLDSKFDWLLWKRLVPRLKKERLWGVFRLEMDILQVLLYMEAEGVLVDEHAMSDLDTELQDKIEVLEKKLYKSAGEVWDLNSAQQKGWFIYEVRGHEPEFFTKKKQEPSTKAEHLERFGKDKAVADLLEYAKLTKLHSTYVSGLIPLLKNGKLHADFKQVGTKTGRFSCAQPNLQNIPRRGENGQLIRSMFIAPPGYVMVIADYSQIELRVLAHYCKDPTLIRVFERDEDPHTATAQAVLALKKVDDDQRDVGKTLNFAIVYGAGAGKVAATAKVSLTKAKKYLRTHQDQFPRIYEWKDEIVREARRKKPPYVTTILGRKRRLPYILSRDDDLRSGAERQAANTKVQGSAGDIIKIAMVRLHEMLGPEMQQILTVHDEIATLVREEDAEECATIVQKAMEGVDLLTVPLRADAKIVERWSDAK